MKSTRLLAAAVAVIGAVTLAVSTDVAAAAPVYGTWAVAGPGAASFTSNVAGSPNATVTSTVNPTAPQAAFLNAATPFGAVYGSSQGSNYMNVATGATFSTTTIAFDGQTPPGWGMAFSDIDADTLQIAAIGADGVTALTAAQLGFQDTFNFCQFATPRPGTCSIIPTPSDEPTWDPATATLTGNVLDTAGASAWFQPTVPLTSLTLTFTRLAGVSPIFQMWIAQPANLITGVVDTVDDVPVPEGTTVTVIDEADNEVASVPVDPDGNFEVPVVPAPYTLEIVPAPGATVIGPTTLPVDATDGDPAPVTFALQVAPTTTTTTSTTTSTTSTTTTTTTIAGGGGSTPTTQRPPRGTLPATGGSSGSSTAGALAFLGLGTALVLVARRRPVTR